MPATARHNAERPIVAHASPSAAAGVSVIQPLHRGRRRTLAAVLVLTLLVVGCGNVAKPRGWSAPVANDTLIFTSRDAGKLSAYRLSEGNGRVWEFPSKEAKLTLLGIYGTPVLEGDTLFIGGYNGSVVALGTDGGERWRHKVGERVIGALLVTADTVYAGNDAGQLVAIDRANGNERWRARVANEIWSTPVTDGSAIYLAGMDGSVTALGFDGARKWRTAVAEAAIAGTPTLKDGVLYLGSYDRRLYAIDARTGAVQWRSAETATNWFWTEPLVDGDTLYAGNLDGRVYALDRATGVRRWRSENLGSQVRGRLALKDGVLLAPTRGGQLWGLRPDSGQKAWEPAQVGGQLYSDLTLLRQDVLLAAESGRSSHKLYRVNAAAGSVTEIPLNN